MCLFFSHFRSVVAVCSDIVDRDDTYASHSCLHLISLSSTFTLISFCCLSVCTRFTQRIFILNSSIVISVESLFEELFIKNSIFFRSLRRSVFSSEISSSINIIISSLIHSFLSSSLSSSRYSSQSFCLESIMIVYQMIDSIFAFCEIFSDVENISASR